MSKYYELMEMEKNEALRANSAPETALSIPYNSRNGLVPHSCESQNGSVPHRVADDSTLELVQRIFLERTQDPPRVVVFAAVDHGSGCSQIATWVAQTLAGKSLEPVCLVEANFRSPALPRILGTTNHQGLTSALLEQGGIHSYLKPVCNSGVWLLSSGPVAADSPDLLGSRRMRARCAELREGFDFVIVDAPPMARYTDAITLGRLCDGIVLVLEAGSTRRKAARAVVNKLRSSGVKILGAVLNKRTYPIPERIYNML
jgi:capsular exopolysaccharide synthesis family protein